MGCWQKYRILNPLLTPLSPRAFVHRPTTLHVNCLHASHWMAPFRPQSIFYLQLVTFQRIIFFGSFMNLPLLFLFWLCVADAIFVYKPLRDIFSLAELADSHATLTWDAQKKCAQTIGANVLKYHLSPVLLRSRWWETCIATRKERKTTSGNLNHTNKWHRAQNIYFRLAQGKSMLILSCTGKSAIKVQRIAQVERWSFWGKLGTFSAAYTVPLLIRAVQADPLMNREIPSKISEFMIMSSGYINMQRSEENRCRGKNGEGKLCRCKEGNTRKQVAWCYRVLIKNRTAFREV